MIEVNLYSIQPGDSNARVGKCLARNRFDREAMGVSVEDFAKEFLRNNLDKFEAGVGNQDLTEMINSVVTMSRKDLACVNFYLIQAGYMLEIQNVADDEENAVGVPEGEVIEWNIIDRNFVQNDYPTATKIMPAPGTDIPTILKQVAEGSGLFNPDKFAGLKDPFDTLFVNLDRIKKVSGEVNATLVTRVYEYLDELGISIFCATSED